VLLGPSGSGKSTVLRMIAGLSEMDSGRRALKRPRRHRLPPQKRGVGFVFQNYALFRTMTVAENVEFALKVRKVAAASGARRRDELLELVGLAGLGGRLPKQLSGGQQQRVALRARPGAQPDSLLLDEPFGALDARIRTELRRTIRTIQRELQWRRSSSPTTRTKPSSSPTASACLHLGRLLEVGPPQELYLRPRTEFVATFLGTAISSSARAPRTACGSARSRSPLATVARSETSPRRVQGALPARGRGARRAQGGPRASGPRPARDRAQHLRRRDRAPAPAAAPPPRARVRSRPRRPFGTDSVLGRGEPHAASVCAVCRSLPAESAWVGVRHVHALEHPGLALLLVADPSPAGGARAGASASEIARRARTPASRCSVPSRTPNRRRFAKRGRRWAA
jgi:sulfate transport system ATP-binding protein